MGMLHDHHPGHEGFLVGFRRFDGWWHELATENGRGLFVHAMCVGCTCGWRSPRFHAPAGAHWIPFIVIAGVDGAADEEFRDTVVWPLFHNHLQAMREIDARCGTGTYPASRIVEFLGKATQPATHESPRSREDA